MERSFSAAVTVFIGIWLSFMVGKWTERWEVKVSSEKSHYQKALETQDSLCHLGEYLLHMQGFLKELKGYRAADDGQLIEKADAQWRQWVRRYTALLDDHDKDIRAQNFDKAESVPPGCNPLKTKEQFPNFSDSIP